MHRTKSSLIAAAILVVALAGSAQAQTQSNSIPKGWSLGGGVGLTASPTTFLMNFDAPYSFGNNLSLGPQLQIGVDGNVTVVSATVQSRYDFMLGLSPDFHPFVNGGIGLTYESFGPGVFSVGGTGFLIAFGGGVEFRMNNHVSLESAVQFNVIASGAGPGNADHFYWSWQMLGARYRF